MKVFLVQSRYKDLLKRIVKSVVKSNDCILLHSTIAEKWTMSIRQKR